MTDELTTREKALVEAARRLQGQYDFQGTNPVTTEFISALRAYDPPKPKVYVLPEWEELTKHGCIGVNADCGQYIIWNGVPLYRGAYNHLRELTAKEQE